MRTNLISGLTCWMLCSIAGGQDINLDGVVDCADSELLGDAIVSANMDSRFDFDGNGVVEFADHWIWREAALFDRDTHGDEDVNLDNVVDQRDGLVYALNFNVPHPYGYCRGDTNLDGMSTRVENDLFNYGANATVPFDSSPITIDAIGNPLRAWAADGVVIAESESFRLVAVPQIAPDKFLSTKLVVQTTNSDDGVAMIHNMVFAGDAHNVWFPSPFGTPTTLPSHFTGALWDEATVEQLVRVDSHLLIDFEHINYGLGGAIGVTTEANDVSNPTGFMGPNAPFGFGTYVYGLGNLESSYPDASMFSLKKEFRTNSVEIVQLVTPAQMPNTGGPGRISIRLGVGGGKSDGRAIQDFPVFGLVEPLNVPFFAVPCDSDADGVCDLADLKRIDNALGRNDAPEFDVDVSGVVDGQDIGIWVSWYEQQSGNTAIGGDADLDGDVDAADLNRIGLHWQMQNGGLSGGDFNHDGVTDSGDLNIVGLNWQVVSSGPVPEPRSRLATLLMLLAMSGLSRTRKIRFDSFIPLEL